jgi:hypothetical protein
VSSRPLRSLPLVAPSEQLSGLAPAIVERSAARCRPGDATHRGLILVAVCIARRAISQCLPPSARRTGEEALVAAESWTTSGDAALVKKHRSLAFEAIGAVERQTGEAVKAAMDSSPITAFDAHADRVVLRYARLGAYYAASTVVLTLDGIANPRDMVRVPSQAAGALAYRNTALGPARSRELRDKARDQSEFEAERDDSHDASSMTVQLFHEYVGATWKDLSDAQRLYHEDFVTWALASTLD